MADGIHVQLYEKSTERYNSAKYRPIGQNLVSARLWAPKILFKKANMYMVLLRR